MDLTRNVGINQIEESSIVKKVLKGLNFGVELKRAGFNERGIGGHSAYLLIYRIMVSLFLGKSLKPLWAPNSEIADCLKGNSGKNCYYRFLKQPRLNWRKLTQKVSNKVVKKLLPYTETKDTVLVLDDTPIHKRGKKIELLSTQYDHVSHKYFKGFTQMHLGWNDGNSFIPLDFCIKVGNKIVSTTNKALDGRICGAKRRSESHLGKLEQSLQMLKRAYNLGVDVGHVVFDTWFAKPVFIKRVLEIGYSSVFHMPKNKNMWQLNYNGQKWSLKELYRLLRSQKAFRKVCIGNINEEIASIIVSHNNELVLKLVFCRLENKSWSVYGTTNVELSDVDILKTYIKRWPIEPFFKDAKQLFKLGKEQSTDFDVQVALTSIRMISYTITAYLKRLTQDERTVGDLFCTVSNDFSKLNLDNDILEHIFEISLNILEIPKSAIRHLKSVFDYICDNFATKGLYQNLAINQVT